MGKSWRLSMVCLTLGACALSGCVQPPTEKSIQASRIPSKGDAGKRQDLTAADITQSWQAQADRLEKDNKLHEAVALYEKMREPGNPQAILATKKLAELFDRARDLDRAEEEYKRLLTQNPNDADLRVKIGDMCSRRGQWAAAEKWYSDALTRQPSHVSARSGLGFAMAQQGAYEQSVKEFAKVLGSEAEACCEVAFVLKLQGKVQDAMQYYYRATQLDPALDRARLEMLRIQQVQSTKFADPMGFPKANTPSVTVGRQGMVDLEPASGPMIEDTGRLPMQRPSLPPLEMVIPSRK